MISIGVFLVLEYCEAGSLHDRLCALGPGELLASAEQESIIHDMLEGLAAIHASSVCHLDIKKDNVLLSAPDGTLYAKWCDLGEALELPDSVHGIPSAFDAKDFDVLPYHMRRRAPEVWRRQGFGPGADIFAVGTIAAEMMLSTNLLLGADESEQQQLIAELDGNISKLHQEGELTQLQAELLKTILADDPSQRESAHSILALPYFHDCRSRRGNAARAPRKILKAKRPPKAGNTPQ